ncbi:MAG: hypothetical protein C0404_03805 [Verrucomicrobia bacterium]|nr:hypothetical protein [Verrucomicrobiota bacterium]
MRLAAIIAVIGSASVSLVLMVVNDAGTLVESYRYDAWGRVPGIYNGEGIADWVWDSPRDLTVYEILFTGERR